MRALSPSDLLDIWEQGLTQSPVRRVLSLLAATFPETSLDALAQLPLGQRNALLLNLREWFFGSRFTGIAGCPNCGERLEFNLILADLDANTPLIDQPLALTLDEHAVRVRLPDSRDLLVIANESDVTAARDLLLQRCLVEAKHNGAEKSADELPNEVVNSIAEAMERADPQANLECGLTCPQCYHAWHANFDIATILWSELNAWAIRTLREVHALASAYGWSEADILAHSPRRRQLYLEMIGA
jgi:uncharacterized protein (UPF0212 family)